jgi:photosystem II stability/assembly factor-like uncharacterized protein
MITKHVQIKKSPLFLIGLLAVLSFQNVKAQYIIQKTSEKQRLEWYNQYLELKKNSIFKNLNWQFAGPTNISGRMTDVEVVSPKGKNYTIYVAGATGGIWKTENEGISWNPVFEYGMSTSFGDLALDPQNQNILWAGTGECNIFRSSNAGAGIYRSKDAGKTWEHLGLVATQTISRIIVHPKNQDVVFVAAGGNEWTNNPERGVYKTNDGGKSWKKILYVDENTGAYDLIMHPENTEIMYTATWQRVRKKWNDPRNETEYKESGIFKTTDGGKNWKKINEGLPEPRFRGRIGIDLCRSKSETIYAFVDNYEKSGNEDPRSTSNDAYGRPIGGRIKGATVYRSDNGGERWYQVSESNRYMESLSGTYGWVFGQIRVCPVNPEKVFVMGIELHVSENGGKTFKAIGDQHGDHHGLWIDPENPDYMVNVNDGGVAIAYDGENFRTFYNNLPLVQFFNLSSDMASPFRVYGSVQDHGSFRGIIDLRQGRNRIPAVEFERAPGGEGSIHAIDPTNPDKVYSAGFYGTISQTNMQTRQAKNIMPAKPEGVDRLRCQWLAPFILSPHNPGILYHGSQFVHRSMNEGKSWEKISPDLTYNDPVKVGDIPFQTVFSISESPVKFGLIYAGTDDGRVWISRNSGTDWNEIVKGLPFGKWVAQIEASAFKESRVYMAQNGKRDDDFSAYLWKSDNYGQDWTRIKSNIPYGPINVIKEDPVDENILYAGTDYGVYVSLNQGQSWEALPGKLPNTYVHDLIIHPRDEVMVIATHGRGIWVLDVRDIRKVAKTSKDVRCRILTVEECTLPLRPEAWYRRSVKPLDAPVFISSSEKLRISIADAQGKEVKGWDFAADKGLNYIGWDLTTDGEKLVEQGKYLLKIKGNGFEESKEFEVRKGRSPQFSGNED